MSTFSEFALSPAILDAVAAEGYTTPTPIQVQAIPPVLKARDLLGIAQTGTGKTAAFALPILERLSHAEGRPRPRSVRALVLSPTRELAAQIADSFRVYGKNLRLRIETVFGGVPIPKQERALAQGVDILVATPGRLLDLCDRRALTLADVQILVLDEADQMLDLGFVHALKRIVTLLPKVRQTLFFSATMPKPIEALASQYLHNPVQVAVAPVATTAERVTQSVIHVPAGKKTLLLAHVLRQPGVERTLVFTRTKHGADKVVRHLAREHIEAVAIHGNKSQSQRMRALDAFKSGAAPVLIATDIAARGIDVEAVSHVINFELPNVPEQYVHRIGRTARAGAGGEAIAFCDGGEERVYLRDIEKLTRQAIPVKPLPEAVAAAAAPEPMPEVRRPHPNPGQRRGGPRPSQGKGAGAKHGKPHRGKASGGKASGGGKPGGAHASGQPGGGHPGGGRPGGKPSAQDRRDKLWSNR